MEPTVKCKGGGRESEKDITNHGPQREEEVGGVGGREVSLPKLWKQHLGQKKRKEHSALRDPTIGLL